MNQTELRNYLRLHYPRENERCEWKAWASLKHDVRGRAGDDLVSYISAISNMDGGVVVIGVTDRSLEVVGIADLHNYTPENLPHLLLEHCTHLPSEGLRVESLRAADTGHEVWLVHVPRHLPRRAVVAHRRAWQRVGEVLDELRPERSDAILSEPLAAEDWSVEVVRGASLDDLDPAALARARENFSVRNATKPWAADVAGWSDAVFLDKAKITVQGGITRTALLLLGRPESTHFLSPQPAQITWKLVAERAVEHFGPPFLLTTSDVLARVRIVNIKLYPATQLLPYELPKYETRVLLEALHNCVAHQDHERAERIVIEEHPGHLVFRNAGNFFDGTPAMYVTGQRQPSRYRNAFLSAAMVNIGMIDTGGMGIGFMVAQQVQRFLPLPDYEESTATQTVLKVFGQTIDENYSRLLMERSDLPIEQVVWLDRVQKRQTIGDDQGAQLKRQGLIEGRKPNWHVSADVADATDQRAEYTRSRGLDDLHYRQLVIAHLKRFGHATGEELNRLLLDKLPEVLSPTQKQAKVKNLRTALRLRGQDGWKIVADRRGAGAQWRLIKAGE